MAVTRNPNPAVESLDAVFSDLSSKWAGYGLPHPRYNAVEYAPEPAPARNGRGPASYSGPEPPPSLEDPANTKAAYEWFQAERTRLEEYTRYQFAAIQQHQQAEMANYYRREEALVQRAQEVNREMQFLAKQSEAKKSS